MASLSKAGQWLENQNQDTRPVQPATQQQRQEAKETRFANTIRIETDRDVGPTHRLTKSD